MARVKVELYGKRGHRKTDIQPDRRFTNPRFGQVAPAPTPPATITPELKTSAELQAEQVTAVMPAFNTAYTAVGKVIEVIHEKGMQDDLDDNWQAGMGNLREVDNTLENLENLLCLKAEGLTGDALDAAMFEI